MTTSPTDPSDDMPDADWLDQHGDDADQAEDDLSVGDVEADPADRLDQTLDVPDDDEDDYDRV